MSSDSLSEKFYAKALALSSQPFAARSFDGRVIACNSAFCELTGYTEEELRSLKQNSDPALLPDWIKHEREVLKELRRTGVPQHFESRFVRKDGSDKIIEMKLHMVCDDKGDPLFYFAFATDITERKRAEEALQKSEERMKLILEESQDGFWDWNIKTGEVFYSPRWAEIHGYSSIELPPRIINLDYYLNGNINRSFFYRNWSLKTGN